MDAALTVGAPLLYKAGEKVIEAAGKYLSPKKQRKPKAKNSKASQPKKQTRPRPVKPSTPRPARVVAQTKLPASIGSTIGEYHKETRNAAPFTKNFNESATFIGSFQVGSVASGAANYGIGENLFVQPINPLLFGSSKLTYEARKWQKYHFDWIKFRYMPSVSSLTPGSFCLGVMDNVTTSVPGAGNDGIVKLSQFTGAKSHSVNAPQTFLKKFPIPTTPYLLNIRNGADLLSALSTQAKLIIKANLGITANTVYGSIEFEYCIHFYDSSFPDLEKFYSYRGPLTLGVYWSTKVFSGGAYHYYIHTPEGVNSFPVKPKDQYYTLILAEDLTIYSFHQYSQQGEEITYKAGVTMYLYQPSEDLNIAFIWDEVTSIGNMSLALYNTATTANKDFGGYISQFEADGPDSFKTKKSIGQEVVSDEEFKLYQCSGYPRYFKNLEHRLWLVSDHRKAALKAKEQLKPKEEPEDLKLVFDQPLEVKQPDAKFADLIHAMFNKGMVTQDVAQHLLKAHEEVPAYK